MWDRGRCCGQRAQVVNARVRINNGMLALATAAYTAGHLLAIVLLAAGAIRLGLRALDRRGEGAEAGRMPPAPLATPAPAATDSVGPPGFAEPARAFAPSATPSRRRIGRSRRERTTDAIAAGVCAVLLVGALLRFVGHDAAADGPWNTSQGKAVRAGFMVRCEQNAAAIQVDCGCFFDRVTSAAPYDTPAEYMTLEVTMARVIRAGDPNAVPPELVGALHGCAIG